MILDLRSGHSGMHVCWHLSGNSWNSLVTVTFNSHVWGSIGVAIGAGWIGSMGSIGIGIGIEIGIGIAIGIGIGTGIGWSWAWFSVHVEIGDWWIGDSDWIWSRIGIWAVTLCSLSMSDWYGSRDGRSFVSSILSIATRTLLMGTWMLLWLLALSLRSWSRMGDTVDPDVESRLLRARVDSESRFEGDRDRGKSISRLIFSLSIGIDWLWGIAIVLRRAWVLVPVRKLSSSSSSENSSIISNNLDIENGGRGS